MSRPTASTAWTRPSTTTEPIPISFDAMAPPRQPDRSARRPRRSSPAHRWTRRSKCDRQHSGAIAWWPVLRRPSRDAVSFSYKPSRRRGPSLHVRTRPTFSVATSPACSKTARAGAHRASRQARRPRPAASSASGPLSRRVRAQRQRSPARHPGSSARRTTARVRRATSSTTLACRQHFPHRSPRVLRRSSRLIPSPTTGSIDQACSRPRRWPRVSAAPTTT